MRRVVIVGAGPAGIRAAERLVDAGLEPVIVDENAADGGQIYRQQPKNFRRNYEQLYGDEAAKARRLHQAFQSIRPKVDYRACTLVWGLAENTLHISSGVRTAELSFDALILATGATDRLMPIRGWTLPGVFSMGGAQIALKTQGCSIGRSTALIGTGPLMYLLAYQYLKAGAKLVGIFDTSPFSNQLLSLPNLLSSPRTLALGAKYRLALLHNGILVQSGILPVAFEGSRKVEAFVYRDRRGKTQRVACDGAAIGFSLRSETQLADLAGVPFAFDPLTRQWLPECELNGRTRRGDIYLAGDGARIGGADVAEITGRLAADSLLEDLGLSIDHERREGDLRTLSRWARFRRGIEEAFPWPHMLVQAVPDDVVVCRCESITAGELRRSIELSAGDINRAKALCRFGMGRCQGRYCGSAGVEILAGHMNLPVSAVGRLRPQAPLKPFHCEDEEAHL